MRIFSIYDLRLADSVLFLVIRVESKRRRVLVGNLQAKPAGLPKISTQLLRPSSLSLTMVVVLVNPRTVEFADDRARKSEGSNLYL